MFTFEVIEVFAKSRLQLRQQNQNNHHRDSAQKQGAVAHSQPTAFSDYNKRVNEFGSEWHQKWEGLGQAYAHC